MVIAGKAKSKSKKKRRALCIGRAFKGGTGNNKKGKKARRIAPANVAPVPEEPLGGVGDANLPVKKRRRAEEPTARATRSVQEPTLNCKPRGPAAAKPKKVPVSALSPGSQEQRRKRIHAKTANYGLVVGRVYGYGRAIRTTQDFFSQNLRGTHTNPTKSHCTSPRPP